MELLKPHQEALEYMEVFGFAPLKRSLCERGMRGRIFRAKGLGKSCIMEAYLSDQVLACVSGGGEKAAFCKLPSLSGEDAAILCSFVCSLVHSLSHTLNYQSWQADAGWPSSFGILSDGREYPPPHSLCLFIREALPFI